MTHAPPTADDQIKFLADIQTLLAEGQFTATYKFALLIALADLAVEIGDDSGHPLEIPVRKIAEKFIDYYWAQTLPWSPAGRDAAAGILAQNTGKNAEVLSRVRAVRESHSEYLIDARRVPAVWKPLLARVTQVVKVMPLWKLQRLPGRTFDFLYPNAGAGDTITLRPGVAFNLRRFHPLVTGMARAAWADFVRKLRPNQRLLGQAVDLHQFLFGTTRADLSVVRRVLKDVQGNRCLYCGQAIAGAPAVDHFVPWSRYPVDLAHNFVLSDRGCNGHKSDFLAAVRHLERWVRRNDDHGEEIEERFAAVHAPLDRDVSLQITGWAYGQVERANGRVWVSGATLAPLEAGWRGVLGG